MSACQTFNNKYPPINSIHANEMVQLDLFLTILNDILHNNQVFMLNFMGHNMTLKIMDVLLTCRILLKL